MAALRAAISAPRISNCAFLLLRGGAWRILQYFFEDVKGMDILVKAG
jgi:hypothetical protein